MDYQELLEQHGSLTAAAKHVGIARSTFTNRLKNQASKNVSDTIQETGVKQKPTLDQIIKRHQVDLTQWKVNSFVIKEYEQGAKDNEGRLISQKLYSYTVSLTKVLKFSLGDFVSKELAKMQKQSPYIATFKKQQEDGRIAFFHLTDIHLGMMSHGSITGDTYNIEICRQRYLDHVLKLCQRINWDTISKVQFVIGSDFFHADHSRRATPRSNNQLDVDMSIPWQEMFAIGHDMVIQAIEMIKTYKKIPIDVIYARGNHDEESSFTLAYSVFARYYNDKNISVDLCLKNRKYYLYGKTMYCVGHGDERVKDVASVYMREGKDFYSKAENFLYFTGHLHKKGETRWNAGDTFNGIEVHISPAICSADKWHYENGYIGNSNKSIVYILDKKEGLVGTVRAK